MAATRKKNVNAELCGDLVWAGSNRKEKKEKTRVSGVSPAGDRLSEEGIPAGNTFDRKVRDPHLKPKKRGGAGS